MGLLLEIGIILNRQERQGRRENKRLDVSEKIFPLAPSPYKFSRKPIAILLCFSICPMTCFAL